MDPRDDPYAQENLDLTFANIPLGGEVDVGNGETIEFCVVSDALASPGPHPPHQVDDLGNMEPGSPVV